MLRLPSQQALKALRNPLRNPFQNAVRQPLLMRQVHIEQAPFIGPPTYETLTRRFSSYPNPLAYYRKKKEDEALSRGEFVDIHDIGGVDPKDFDVLITDMDESTLRNEIAELAGIQYLKEASQDEALKRVEIGKGFIFGNMSRTIFPCVVSTSKSARWVFFLVDSGSPLTYISSHTADALGILKNNTPVRIAGYDHTVSISPGISHFAPLNLLGSDFYGKKIHVSEFDPIAGTVNMYFNSGWKVSR
ncbi:hypothetical protein K469DRAFT_749516 [Zopfia rhizophila CBS 207.26]|uniref:Uncharacterized protein n=1 Tax=Zopfia rhizophila CBS 207.26 TaxID=1314779 RepID=A0A6A6E8N2_9PEZI|nr:hypothetical protein K469DRAFT_749516 [Zopfia rhizophila CBS 207.26]